MLRLAARVLLGVAGLAVLALIADFATTPRYDGPPSRLFNGTIFVDPDFRRPSMRDVLRWQMNRPDDNWEFRPLAVESARPPVSQDAGIRITLINHATLLVQFAGYNVLTDPIWSQHAGPLGALGPQRYRPAGLDIEDLPPLDAVLISHNHYDHMDLPTLEKLARDPQLPFIAPLGNRPYLEGGGVENIVELDWWSEHTLAPALTITAVPAKHWSRRRTFDTNRALWAGFVLEANGRRVYFAGDTGDGPHFREIRERLGPPDVAMLPIGAYLPRWFMKPQHISPLEALAAHEELAARHSVAMHFATFRLADDGQDQARRELERALSPGISFWLPDNGESRVFETP